MRVVTDAVRRCLSYWITACPLASSSKTKPRQFSSVMSLCTRLYIPLNQRGVSPFALWCRCNG